MRKQPDEEAVMHLKREPNSSLLSQNGEPSRSRRRLSFGRQKRIAPRSGA